MRYRGFEVEVNPVPAYGDDAVHYETARQRYWVHAPTGLFTVRLAGLGRVLALSAREAVELAHQMIDGKLGPA